MKSIKGILSQTSWWLLNKELCRKVGIDAALILADLCTKQEYFYNREELDRTGFFFNTSKNIQEDTTLSLYQQSRALEILLRENLIETKKYGTPCRIFYRVNLSFLNDYIIKLHKEEVKRKKEEKNKKKVLIYETEVI